MRHRIACETNLGCAYLPECDKILKDDFINLSSHYNKNGDDNDPDNTSCLFDSLNIHLPITPDHVVVNNESTSRSNIYNNNNNGQKSTRANSKFLGSGSSKSRGGRRKQNCRNMKRAKNHNVIGTINKVNAIENDQSGIYVFGHSFSYYHHYCYY